MARPKQSGVTLHKATQQWYYRDKGKRIYCGKDRDEALRRWHRFELERALELDAKVKPSAIAKRQMKFSSDGDFALADSDYVSILTDEEVERDLDEYERDRRGDLIQRKPDSVRAAQGPTCQDVVDAYLKYLEAEASPSHFGDAQARLLVRMSPKGMPTWLEHIGPDTPINALTRDDFTGFRGILNKLVSDGRYTQSYVNKMFILVKGAFTAANREKGLTAPLLPSFVKILKTKTPNQTDRTIFTPTDIKRMLEDFDLKFCCITLLALNCGMTNTDIGRDLKWGMIRWKQKYLDFNRVKQKGIRRTPLWSRTIKKLEEYRATCDLVGDGDLVFPNENGKPYIVVRKGKNGRTNKNDYLSTAFRRKFKKLGIEASFGIFRKSAATIGLNGGDKTAVEMFLGDAPSKIWKRYAMMEKGQNVKVRAVTAAIESHFFSRGSRRRTK